MNIKPGELTALFKKRSRKSFFHFDLELSEQEQEILEKMRVREAATYNNFGDIGKIESDAAKFFELIGNDFGASKEQSAIVARLIEKTISRFGAETAWVTIRAFQPMSSFDIPRWHTDGYFYPPFSGDQMKAVLALKGAGTFLYDMPEGQRHDFMKLQQQQGALQEDEMSQRQRIAALVDKAQTETSPAGCGTVFIVGSDRAAVHSEPPIHVERVFISVVPGNKEQIENLRMRWNVGSKSQVKRASSRQANP